jgi:hypothetical protein
VYWARRLTLIVVASLVATGAWWALGRFTGDAAAGSDDGSSAAADGGGQSAGSAQSSQRQTKPHQNHGGAKKHSKKAHGPAQPSGECAPADVEIVIDVADVEAGHRQPIRLKLTSVGVAACTLAITPDTLAMRVVSGDDVIWSSEDCPNALLARELVVRAHRPTVYEFDWDGYRSTDTCSKPGTVAKPGGYWAEAALIGANVHRAYFDVT